MKIKFYKFNEHLETLKLVSNEKLKSEHKNFEKPLNL